MIDLIPSQYQSTHMVLQMSVRKQSSCISFKFLFFTYFLYSTYMLCPTLCPFSPHYAPAFLFLLFSQTCVRPAILFFILWYRQLLLLFKHHQRINQLFFFFACQINSSPILVLHCDDDDVRGNVEWLMPLLMCVSDQHVAECRISRL